MCSFEINTIHHNILHYRHGYSKFKYFFCAPCWAIDSHDYYVSSLITKLKRTKLIRNPHLCDTLYTNVCTYNEFFFQTFKIVRKIIFATFQGIQLRYNKIYDKFQYSWKTASLYDNFTLTWYIYTLTYIYRMNKLLRSILVSTIRL